MSKKYYESLAKGTGVSNRQVDSEFGRKILAKFGWQAGDGLGKERDGRTECIQVRRREEGVGLGVEAETGPQRIKEMWWQDAFNNSVQKLNIVLGDESEDEEEDRTVHKKPVHKKKPMRKMSRLSSSEEDTDSDEDDRIMRIRKSIQKKPRSSKK